MLILIRSSSAYLDSIRLCCLGVSFGGDTGFLDTGGLLPKGAVFGTTGCMFTRDLLPMSFFGSLCMASRGH